MIQREIRSAGQRESFSSHRTSLCLLFVRELASPNSRKLFNRQRARRPVIRGDLVYDLHRLRIAPLADEVPRAFGEVEDEEADGPEEEGDPA